MAIGVSGEFSFPIGWVFLDFVGLQFDLASCLLGSGICRVWVVLFE